MFRSPILPGLLGLACACGGRSSLSVLDDGGGAGGGHPTPTTATDASSSSQGTGGAGGQPDACVPLTTDVFDPDEVYVVGTLVEGTCGFAALAHWCDPNTAIVGLDDCFANYDSYVIRTDTGRFVYRAYGRPGEQVPTRELRCDQCPFSAEAPYPENVTANDVELSLAGCEAPWAVFAAPPGGLVTSCGSGYHDSSGTLLYSPPADFDDQLFHLGYDGLALARRHVVDLATGVGVPITGLRGTMHTARALQGRGFRVVVGTDPDADLYRIGSDGLATHLGAYSPVPEGILAHAATSKLDASGRLYQLGFRAGADGIGVIVRREIEGRTEVVYDELDNPLVRLHASELVTGP